jgi:hypothetical protein
MLLMTAPGQQRSPISYLLWQLTLPLNLTASTGWLRPKSIAVRRFQIIRCHDENIPSCMTDDKRQETTTIGQVKQAAHHARNTNSNRATHAFGIVMRKAANSAWPMVISHSLIVTGKIKPTSRQYQPRLRNIHVVMASTTPNAGKLENRQPTDSTLVKISFVLTPTKMTSNISMIAERRSLLLMIYCLAA